MSIARQLYQLQEVELEIDHNEQALKQIESQLGDNQVVVAVRDKLAQEQQCLEEQKRQQHEAEWAIDDIRNKLTSVEDNLYSGKIKNPKELTNLQQEAEGLKAKCKGLEDQELDIMEQIELVMANADEISRELKTVEAEWQQQQEKLSGEKERLRGALSDLESRRQLMIAEIAAPAVEVYYGLKEKKGQAVARVEQGICRGCRILLATAELQRVRSRDLVQCGSCGRILFLA